MSTAQPARVQSELLTDRSRDRKFFTAYSFLGIAAVFIGFARTYYLRAFTEAPPLSTIVHLHAVIFSVWMLLFAVQTSLVAAKRVALHRSLGIGSIALAVSMLIFGFITGVTGARNGWMGAQQARDPIGGLSFLAIPLGDLVLFSAFFSMALYYRRQPETHKRLMILVASGTIMPPAFARLPPTVAATFLFSFLLAGPIYDRWSHGRIHRVYKWGVPLIIVSIPARFLLGETESWQRFARWLLDATGL